MTVQHRYDQTSPIPSLKLEVGVSHPMEGDPITERAAVDTGAAITKIPLGLKANLGELKRMGTTIVKYGNGAKETHPTYLTRISFDDFELDAEVYFREADFILLGRNVLNQLKLIADGKNLLFSFE